MQMVTAATKLKGACSLDECYHKVNRILKSRDIILPTKDSEIYGFSSSHVWIDVRVGLDRRLSAEELMLSNCDAGEDS